MAKPTTRQVKTVAGAVVLNIIASVLYDELKGDGPLRRSNVLLYVVVYTVFACAAVLLVLGLRAMVRNPAVVASEQPFVSRRFGQFFNSIAGALFLGSCIGSLAAAVWIMPIWNATMFPWGMWNYELGMFLALTPLTGLYLRRQRDWVCLIAFVGALSLSISIILEIFRTEDTAIFLTLINWISGGTLVAILWLSVGGPAVGLFGRIRKGLFAAR